MKDRVTPAVQDYLKAIHGLGGVERTVSPIDIAERLKVRAPSVRTRCVSRSPSSGTSEVASKKAVIMARNVAPPAAWTAEEAAGTDTRTRSPLPLATASSPVAVAPSAVTGEPASTWCPATC